MKNILLAKLFGSSSKLSKSKWKSKSCQRLDELSTFEKNRLSSIGTIRRYSAITSPSAGSISSITSSSSLTAQSSLYYDMSSGKKEKKHHHFFRKKPSGPANPMPRPNDGYSAPLHQRSRSMTNLNVSFDPEHEQQYDESRLPEKWQSPQTRNLQYAIPRKVMLIPQQQQHMPQQQALPPQQHYQRARAPVQRRQQMPQVLIQMNRCRSLEQMDSGGSGGSGCASASGGSVTSQRSMPADVELVRHAPDPENGTYSTQVPMMRDIQKYKEMFEKQGLTPTTAGGSGTAVHVRASPESSPRRQPPQQVIRKQLKKAPPQQKVIVRKQPPPRIPSAEEEEIYDEIESPLDTTPTPMTAKAYNYGATLPPNWARQQRRGSLTRQLNENRTLPPQPDYNAQTLPYHRKQSADDVLRIRVGDDSALQDDIYAVELPPQPQGNPIPTPPPPDIYSNDIGAAIVENPYNRKSAPIAPSIDSGYSTSAYSMHSTKSWQDDNANTLKRADVVSTTDPDDIYDLPPPPETPDLDKTLAHDDTEIPPPPPPQFDDSPRSKRVSDHINKFNQPEISPIKKPQLKSSTPVARVQPSKPQDIKHPDTDWTVDEVADWLDSLSLGVYKSVFTDNVVDGAALLAMNNTDFIELGVKLGHRKLMERYLKV